MRGPKHAKMLPFSSSHPHRMSTHHRTTFVEVHEATGFGGLERVSRTNRRVWLRRGMTVVVFSLAACLGVVSPSREPIYRTRLMASPLDNVESRSFVVTNPAANPCSRTDKPISTPTLSPIFLSKLGLFWSGMALSSLHIRGSLAKGRPTKRKENKEKKARKRRAEAELPGPEDEYPVVAVPESTLIPVTIITGFLGAGKTTLVNHVLKANHGMKIAVVENEFGEVSIDDALVSQAISTNETIITMDNGCVCCQLRGDLVDSLRNLALSDTEFDSVILETTGLADPVPVAFTFNQIPLSEVYRMDAIVCLVDASHILQHLAEKPTNGSVNAAVRQVAFADRIVLNKLDLVNTTYKQKVIGEIRSINRFAPIIEANSSVVDLKSILNISAFSIEKAFEIEPELMDDEELNAPYVEHKEGHNDTHQHNHSHHNHHHHSNDRKGSHLSGVSSYGFQFEGLVSMERLNHFMTTFLNLRSEDLFRSKGVLDLAGIQDSKFVFQGVHEQIQLGPAARQWEEGEKKINKFVFIGRKLPPRKYLYDMLQACLVVNEGNSPFPTYNPDDEEKYLHDPKHTHDHAHHGHATT